MEESIAIAKLWVSGVFSQEDFLKCIEAAFDAGRTDGSYAEFESDICYFIKQLEAQKRNG